VIVTGGSEGIGAAVAEAAIDRGARVSLVARGADRLEEVARRLGHDTGWAPADVADRAALTAAIEHLVSRRGPCDVMVANAGYALPGRFWELPDDEFRAEMEVNYLGAVHAAAAVLPEMRRRRRGHLCFTSSTAGVIGVYGYTAYGAAKFAVRGLLESLRTELVPHGVHVGCCYPPDVDTPMLAEEDAFKPTETRAIAGTIKPLSAERVAAAILSGIDARRAEIYADGTTRALARTVAAAPAVYRTLFDRRVRRTASAP